jgi:hypothetical protein
MNQNQTWSVERLDSDIEIRFVCGASGKGSGGAGTRAWEMVLLGMEGGGGGHGGGGGRAEETRGSAYAVVRPPEKNFIVGNWEWTARRG